MRNPDSSLIKKEKKKSFFLREISSLFQKIVLDEPKLSSLFITKVELSKDGGICYIYFSTSTDEEAFKQGLEILKLYRPSMRKALAQIYHSRYVPSLIFRYDKAKEKVNKINILLDQIQQENRNKKE